MPRDEVREKVLGAVEAAAAAGLKAQSAWASIKAIVSRLEHGQDNEAAGLTQLAAMAMILAEHFVINGKTL